MTIVHHHVRGAHNITYAMKLNDEKLVVAYAYAACHPKDQFCKHTGRVKSAGRLKSDRFRTDIIPGVPIKDFLTAVDNQAPVDIMFTKDKAQRLAKAYEEARSSSAFSFDFDGNMYVTDYAKYLLEFLTNKGILP